MRNRYAPTSSSWSSGLPRPAQQDPGERTADVVVAGADQQRTLPGRAGPAPSHTPRRPVVGDVAGDEQDVGSRARAARADHLRGPVDRLRPAADVEVADVGDGEHERRLDPEKGQWGMAVAAVVFMWLNHQSHRRRVMQFGIFTVGDVTTDPTTGRTPTEHERIKATIAIAKKAEEVGLDVFATGEHHNPPFIPSRRPPRWRTSPRRPSG